MLRNDCGLTVRKLADELNVKRETIRFVYTDNLKTKKVWWKVKSKNLTSRNREKN
jgi:orotate phosphoribosyltransferase-like protein